MNAFARFFTILFTIIFLFQNWYFFLFSLKEGFTFPDSLLTLIPAICGIILIWSLYWLTRHIRYGIVGVIVFGILLCIGYELFLPVTPLKTIIAGTKQKELLQNIVVKDMSDEPMRTASGNSIGIIYHATIVFPEDVAMFPSFTLVTPQNASASDMTYILSLDRTDELVIAPVPTRLSGEIEHQFRAGVPYRLTSSSYPHFITKDFYNSKSPDTLCLDFDYGRITQDEVMRVITSAIPTKYENGLLLGFDSYVTLPRSVSYTTSGQYSIAEFYQSMQKENAPRCAKSSY